MNKRPRGGYAATTKATDSDGPIYVAPQKEVEWRSYMGFVPLMDDRGTPTRMSKSPWRTIGLVGGREVRVLQ